MTDHLNMQPYLTCDRCGETVRAFLPKNMPDADSWHCYNAEEGLNGYLRKPTRPDAQPEPKECTNPQGRCQWDGTHVLGCPLDGRAVEGSVTAELTALRAELDSANGDLAASRADVRDWRDGVELVASALGDAEPADLSCVRISELALEARARAETAEAELAEALDLLHREADSHGETLALLARQQPVIDTSLEFYDARIADKWDASRERLAHDAWQIAVEAWREETDHA